MTKEIEHGCMGEEGSPDEHVRKCKIHGWHGYLYPCEEYSENLLKELEELRKNPKIFVESVINGIYKREWISIDEIGDIECH